MNNLYVTPIYLKDQSQFDKLIQNSLRIDSSINIKEFSIKKLWHHIADGLTVDDNNNEKSSVNFVLVVLGHHRRDHGMTLSDSANGKANSSRKTLSSFLASPPDEVLSSPAYPFSELTAVCICQSKLCLCQPRLCTLSTEERIDCFPISTPTELAEKIDSLKKSIAQHPFHLSIDFTRTARIATLHIFFLPPTFIVEPSKYFAFDSRRRFASFTSIPAPADVHDDTGFAVLGVLGVDYANGIIGSAFKTLAPGNRSKDASSSGYQSIWDAVDTYSQLWRPTTVKPRRVLTGKKTPNKPTQGPATNTNLNSNSASIPDTDLNKGSPCATEFGLTAETIAETRSSDACLSSAHSASMEEAGPPHQQSPPADNTPMPNPKSPQHVDGSQSPTMRQSIEFETEEEELFTPRPLVTEGTCRSGLPMEHTSQFNLPKTVVSSDQWISLANRYPSRIPRPKCGQDRSLAKLSQDLSSQPQTSSQSNQSECVLLGENRPVFNSNLTPISSRDISAVVVSNTNDPNDDSNAPKRRGAFQRMFRFESRGDWLLFRDRVSAILTSENVSFNKAYEKVPIMVLANIIRLVQKEYPQFGGHEWEGRIKKVIKHIIQYARQKMFQQDRRRNPQAFSRSRGRPLRTKPDL